MEEKPKKKRVRLSVDISENIMQQLKYIGLMRNCTIRKIVIRALMAYIRHEVVD